MKKTFELGNIDLRGTGKRYPVTVEIELSESGGAERIEYIDGKRTPTGQYTPRYLEFTASASAGAAMAGQCLDRINEHRRDFSGGSRVIWDAIYRLWKLYHLNGMHAGTPEQEAAVKEYKSQCGHYRADYTEVCNHLKEIGLYEVPFIGRTTGREYNGEMYKYGHGWIIQQIPEEDLQRIRDLLDSEW